MKANLQRKGATLWHVAVDMKSDAFVAVVVVLRLLVIVAVETICDSGNERGESSLS